MKSNPCFVLLCLFFFGNCFSAQCQRVAFWKGGTPGMESNWNCPKNWSTGAVPDCFYDVIIPDVSAQSATYPVIADASQEVNSLALQSGASLTIKEKGTLVVNAPFQSYGIEKIEGEGKLLLPVLLASNASSGQMNQIVGISQKQRF